jgi:5-methyltetrahydropteroyltriglutamate--homocysteine methyltransferase
VFLEDGEISERVGPRQRGEQPDHRAVEDDPRTAHAWEVWQDVRLPEGKILIPGVIDSVTTFVEHPDLVAQRILQYARLVGRENVIASPDCGFGTFSAWAPRVHPEIMWAKFRSLVDGARIASERLWGRAA